MVLGLCRCFGAAPAGCNTATLPAGQSGGVREDSKNQHVVRGEEALGEAGEQKLAGFQAQAEVTMEEAKKKKRAPIIVHHFPFHSRPGLL
ncbi:hypothetical protein ACP4OV_015203 [Aristida adscensionis]